MSSLGDGIRGPAGGGSAESGAGPGCGSDSFADGSGRMLGRDSAGTGSVTKPVEASAEARAATLAAQQANTAASSANDTMLFTDGVIKQAGNGLRDTDQYASGQRIDRTESAESSRCRASRCSGS